MMIVRIVRIMRIMMMMIFSGVMRFRILCFLVSKNLFQRLSLL